MKVIFNADDFGYTKAVNYGIIESFENGVVRSASLLVNMPAFEHAVKLYQQNKNNGLGVGLHFNLMMGKPLTKNLNTLIDANGNFYRYELFESNKDYFDNTEIENELEAQIQRAFDYGIELTHIDSHYGIHMKEPLFPIIIKVAQKYNLPLRMLDLNRNNPISAKVRSTEKFNAGFFAQNATFDYLEKLLTTIECNNIEILCRPAYVDIELYNGSRYSLNRIGELSVLCSNELKGFIKKNNIELINYKSI